MNNESPDGPPPAEAVDEAAADASASSPDTRARKFQRVSSAAKVDVVSHDFDPFDPVLRQNDPGSISVLEAFIHLMKGSLGTGILAMAHGFSFIGTLAGFIATVILIGMLGHCVHLILRSQYYQCRRLGTAYIEYPDCMEDAFKNGNAFFRKIAPSTPYIVDFFMLVYQLGTCSCYFIFIASNVQQVTSTYGFYLSDRVWMVIILVPILLLNLIKDLHYLAPISSAGNIAFVLAMFVIYYYLFGYDGTPFEHAKDRPLIIWPPRRWPLFIGTCCFALESIAIIVKIEHHMREPKKFRSRTGVFNCGMFITVTLFSMTGLLGYLKYGDAIESTITLNIASDQKLAQVVKILYAFVIFFSYPLQNFVPLELLWVNYIQHHMVDYSEKKKFIVELIFREVIVLITFGFALVIPHLDLLISLFGAFCLSSLGIIFPVTIHTLVLKHEKIGFGPMNWVFYKNCFLLVFGIFIMVSGTIISIMDIMKAIEDDAKPKL